MSTCSQHSCRHLASQRHWSLCWAPLAKTRTDERTTASRRETKRPSNCVPSDRRRGDVAKRRLAYRLQRRRTVYQYLPWLLHWTSNACTHQSLPRVGGVTERHIHWRKTVACRSVLLRRRYERDCGQDVALCHEPYQGYPWPNA